MCNPPGRRYPSLPSFSRTNPLSLYQTHKSLPPPSNNSLTPLLNLLPHTHLPSLLYPSLPLFSHLNSLNASLHPPSFSPQPSSLTHLFQSHPFKRTSLPPHTSCSPFISPPLSRPPSHFPWPLLILPPPNSPSRPLSLLLSFST